MMAEAANAVIKRFICSPELAPGGTGLDSFVSGFDGNFFVGGERFFSTSKPALRSRSRPPY
jgi:hypothetical protein